MGGVRGAHASAGSRKRVAPAARHTRGQERFGMRIFQMLIVIFVSPGGVELRDCGRMRAKVTRQGCPTARTGESFRDRGRPRIMMEDRDNIGA